MVLSPASRELRGMLGRGRRELRRRSLEPLLVGQPTLRDIVMRGHLVSCELDHARFFVDPGDRVVGAWLMRRGRLAVGARSSAPSRSLQQPAESRPTRYSSTSVPISARRRIMRRTAAASAALSPRARPIQRRAAGNESQGQRSSDYTLIDAKAAGATVRRAVLHLHPRNEGAHAIGIAPRIDGRDRVEVPMVRLDEALGEFGFDAAAIGLVWINVEGCEPQVLEGRAVIMKHAVPVAFEFTPERYDAASKARLVERFAAHCTRLGGAAGTAAPVLTLASIDTIDDVLVY